MTPDLRTAVGDLRLANPVLTASGTFGASKPSPDATFWALSRIAVIGSPTLNFFKTSSVYSSSGPTRLNLLIRPSISPGTLTKTPKSVTFVTVPLIVENFG